MYKEEINQLCLWRMDTICHMTFGKTGSLAKCTKDRNNGLQSNVNILYSLQDHHLNNKNMESSLTSKSGNGKHDCEMPWNAEDKKEPPTLENRNSTTTEHLTLI